MISSLAINKSNAETKCETLVSYIVCYANPEIDLAQNYFKVIPLRSSIPCVGIMSDDKLYVVFSFILLLEISECTFSSCIL